ncbi:hypothetical protein ABRQ22_15510 [Cellulosimicrobium sp. ES-005]|uniref:Uncharacterized protein n=1 Tax=Cellulosimicrobium sp. ES-005 TaxID=3163031 RepID=A0AAU8FYH5_9MICO
MSLEALIPQFATPQGPADIVPGSVPLDDLGDIDKASSRFLGRDTAADYWIARSGTSRLCFIAHIRTEGMSASSCADITTFHRHGIGLSAGSGTRDLDTSAEAYLLPSDITPPRVAHENRERIMRAEQSSSSANLVSVNPGSPGLEPFDVSRADGSVFQFAPAREVRE